MIIVAEGRDGSGKSTVCPKLALAMGAVLYKTPPEHMRAEQDHINATASDIDHYRYFVRVVQEASAELSSMQSSRNVVVDRYWISTVVYHRAMGIPAKLEDIGDILMPDLTVYLDVSPEVQARRMVGRGMSPGDIRMSGRQDLLRQIYDEVLSTQRNVFRVNTDNTNPEEVVAMILARTSLAHRG